MLRKKFKKLLLMYKGESIKKEIEDSISAGDKIMKKMNKLDLEMRENNNKIEELIKKLHEIGDSLES